MSNCNGREGCHSAHLREIPLGLYRVVRLGYPRGCHVFVPSKLGRDFAVSRFTGTTGVECRATRAAVGVLACLRLVRGYNGRKEFGVCGVGPWSGVAGKILF